MLEGLMFHDPELWRLAMTHRSLDRTRNNQRLEFLGDRVLGLVVARLLYDAYPNAREGDLAKRQAALVSGQALARVARSLNLGEHIHLAASEEQSGGRENPSNLEDACEALIGALYLDQGLEAAASFIASHWKPLVEGMTSAPRDAKTALQEWAQGRGLPLPVYVEVERSGPDHAPHFTVEVQVEGYAPVRAEADSKRKAQQLAAERMLRQV